MSDVNVTFASQGARKALYFMYSFLFQKYTRACIALEEYNSNLKCCCFLYASSPSSCLRHHVCYLVLKAAKHSFKPSLFSGTLLVASNACEKHRGFVRLFFNYRKQSMSATKLRKKSTKCSFASQNIQAVLPLCFYRRYIQNVVLKIEWIQNL